MMGFSHQTSLCRYSEAVAHLGSLLVIGELSRPQEAALWGEQQEAVATVERPRRRLHQARLDALPACRHSTVNTEP